MRERDIERHLGAWLQASGCLYWKFESPGNAGVPDRIVVCPGRLVIFVELKAKDGELSKLQRLKIALLRERGADVRVIKDLSEAVKFAEEVGNWCSTIRTHTSDTASRPL